MDRSPVSWRLEVLTLAGRTVLDAGARTAVASDALHSAGTCPVAVDLSKDMLAYAAQSQTARGDSRRLRASVG